MSWARGTYGGCRGWRGIGRMDTALVSCVVRVHRVGSLMCSHFRMSKDRLGYECIDYMRYCVHDIHPSVSQGS